GAVTFNVLTTVFTGGAGAGVSGAGKAGAVAKVLSVAGKAGKVIDPMTYIAKGAGAGLSKIGDITKGLKGIGNVEIPTLPDDAIVLPEGALKLPDGAVHLPEGAAIPDGAIELPDGNFKLPDDVPVLPEGATKLPTEPGAPAQYFDGEGNLLDEKGDIVQKAEDARPEPSPDIDPDAAGADTPHTGSPSPDRQPALVGAGAHTADSAAHAGDHVIRLGDSLGNDLGDIGRTGDNLPGTNIGDNLPGGNAGNHLPGGGVGDHMPTGHAGDNLPGSGATHAPGGVGDHLPSNSLDNASGTRVGDGVPGPRTETPAVDGPTAHPGGHDLPGGHADDALPGHPETPGPNGLDDLGHAGDDAVGDATDAAARTDSDAPGGSAQDERPDFMGDGDNPYGPRGSLTDEQIMEIQRYRANHEPGYFEDFYKSNGNRKNLNLVDESGRTPPQLTRASENEPWVAVKDGPEPLKPNYVGDWDKKGAADVSSPARLKTLDEAALKRHLAIRHDKLMETWKQETATAHELLDTVESKAHHGESVGAYKESHSVMRDAAEDFGETAAEHHFIAEQHPGAVREPLDGPANGNDQFDQVWRRKDGGYVVIEAKSSVTTELGARNLPSGRRVSQGTREYFLDIIAEMRKRGENNIDELLLADKLDAALDAGKLDYVVVKGEKNAGTYAGYQMRQFDIAERSTP
ncbi:hypothetical protein ABZS81_27360, partial [Streptomyces sp. NPDC005318]|uniref:hypothetical protein n=1 Tax=Streptomyces sp. NPDC005318 TaxID=3157031 RepID=UPI0033AFC5E0